MESPLVVTTLLLLSLLLFAMPIFTLVGKQSPGGIMTWLFQGPMSLPPQWLAPQLTVLSLVYALCASRFVHDTTIRLAFMVIGLATAILLLYVHCLGFRTARVVDTTIDAAIGRLQLPMGSVPKRIAVAPGTGLRPLAFGKAGVRHIHNVAYGDFGSRNQLDLFLPAEIQVTPKPILIHIPGGAWLTGDKRYVGRPLLYHMVRQGWMCAAINHRPAPRWRFPAMLEDVLRAIAWIKEHARDYDADANFVALTGISAGGHLTTLAALVRERAQFQPGFESVDTTVALAIPVAGRFDFLNRHGILPKDCLQKGLALYLMPGPPKQHGSLWDLASPEAQVNANAPPFLIVHGSRDSLIPIAEARAFERALRQVSQQPVDFLEVPGAEHGFDFLCSSWAMPTVYGISRYLQSHHVAYRLRGVAS